MPLITNQGAPGPLTENQGPINDDQGAPGPLTNNQGAPNQQPRGP